ncbi:MAG: alpha/beta hydrolase [Pseudomonadota bacterium]
MRDDYFSHDGLLLHFVDSGEGGRPPVVMIHGFASNIATNWINPGWFAAFEKVGMRSIAIDNRGHGKSDKPHDDEAYHPEKMADDAVALLDHLNVEKAHIFGYSMGARISAFLALRHPSRVSSLVLGGLGIGMVNGVGDWDPIADALLAPSLDDVSHARGRMFREFADQTGSDRIALASCIRTSRTLVTRGEAASISAPTLIGVGTKDDVAGDAHELADLMPNARAFDIERRDHMLAVGDASFKRAVVSFLDEIG